MNTSVKLNDEQPVEITSGIYWIGFADFEAGFSNNPYLITDGTEAVLFDPGPGHPVFQDIVYAKIRQIIDPRKIRYIVVHHQDPDLCGLIPFLENRLHPELTVLAHPRTALFLPYYGIRRPIVPIGDSDILQLASGRQIQMIHTPYVHFAGSMVSYDIDTQSLLSSDIFAVFNRNWSLYADTSYVEHAKSFLEHYVESETSLKFAYERFKRLSIQRILPQHGGIIDQDIDRFLELLLEARPGRLLRELKDRPSNEQRLIIQKEARQWLASWLHIEIDEQASLEQLLQTAMEHSITTVALFMEEVSRIAERSGTANPLLNGRTHTAETLKAAPVKRILDAVLERYQTRSVGFNASNTAEEALQQGLTAYQTEACIAFIDIRRFTRWSAGKTPEEIISQLSEQHEAVSSVIQANGGYVNKIIGDGILAYFPLHRDEARDAALHACIEIQKLIGSERMLGVGIGLARGEVILGDLGEKTRLDYTLIGSAVNQASRLSDAANRGEILISKNILDGLNEKLRRRVEKLRTSDTISIKIKPYDPELEAIRLCVVRYQASAEG